VVTEPLESLGDSITTAVLLSWAKEPGDGIKEDDVIAVVETDKVTMDIRAKKSGVFVEALAVAGAEITVGGALYKIDTSASAMPVSTNASAPAAVAAPPSKAAAPASGAGEEKVTVPVPIMGESITQGVLASWMAKTGDFVDVDQVVASIETDKVTVEVRSPRAGVISEMFAAQGDEVNVGNPLFALLAGGVAPPKQAAAPKAAAAAAPAAAPSTAKAAAPAPAKAAAPAPAKAAPSPKAATATTAGDRSETRVKMTRMRLRIAQRLKEAQNTAAMLTTFQEVDMGNLIEMRNKHKDEFEKVHGVKLVRFLNVYLVLMSHFLHFTSSSFPPHLLPSSSSSTSTTFA